MRKKTRFLAVGLVGVAVIAACIGSLTFSTTEQEVMTFPTFVSVGSVPVGSPTTTAPITFNPATELDDDTIISITENCTQWSLTRNPLPARVYCDAMGGSGYGSGSCVPFTYSFTATFTPAGPGLDTCPVTVTYSSATPVGSGSGSGTGSGTAGLVMSMATIQLQGTGLAPTYGLGIVPPDNSTLGFGEIPTTTQSSPIRVTITNNGSTPITVMGSNSNATVFPTTPVGTANLTSQTLLPSMSASHDVVCAPTSTGMHSGTLTFTTGAAQGNLSRTLSMTCTGITSTLGIDPAPASFARGTLVGGPPPDVTITLTNMGAATTLTQIRLETANEVEIITNPESQTIPASGSATIVLRYSAATEHPFGQINNLLITHTPGGMRTVAVNAEALIGEIGITPAVVDFGPVCPGSQQTENLMLYATASGPVNLMGITPPNLPFTVPAASGILEPHHGNIIELTARVDATTPGPLSDKFVLQTNLPDAAGMRDVELLGVALPPGVTPTPDLVHFGPSRLNTLTSAKEVVVSNCGAAALAITGARIDGPSAADFAIVSPADPAQTIAMMGELKFLVVMNPRTTGSKSAQLVVEYAGGEVRANLDGNGFGGTDNGGDKGTYYTCSTGGGAGALCGLPIALGLLLLRRRRA